MTTMYDMASGMEIQGTEPSGASPVTHRSPAAPFSSDNQQVELRLALHEPTAATEPASLYPAGLDLKKLIDTLED